MGSDLDFLENIRLNGETEPEGSGSILRCLDGAYPNPMIEAEQDRM